MGGTDSPYRETSNISDGSKFCAGESYRFNLCFKDFRFHLCSDMAIQNCIGDSYQGATSVSLHNGGGKKGLLSKKDGRNNTF